MSDTLQKAVERPISLAPSPLVEIEKQVSLAVMNLRAIVHVIGEHPNAMDAEKAHKIGIFLRAQIEETMRGIDLVLARHPPLGAMFSFDMDLMDAPPRPPQTTQITQTTPSVSTGSFQPPGASPPSLPRFDHYGRRIPAFEGRLAGSKEKVRTSISTLPVATDEVIDDETGVGFIEEK